MTYLFKGMNYFCKRQLLLFFNKSGSALRVRPRCLYCVYKVSRANINLLANSKLQSFKLYIGGEVFNSQ